MWHRNQILKIPRPFNSFISTYLPAALCLNSLSFRSSAFIFWILTSQSALTAVNEPMQAAVSVMTLQHSDSVSDLGCLHCSCIQELHVSERKPWWKRQKRHLRSLQTQLIFSRNICSEKERQAGEKLCFQELMQPYMQRLLHSSNIKSKLQKNTMFFFFSNKSNYTMKQPFQQITPNFSHKEQQAPLHVSTNPFVNTFTSGC